MEDKARQNKLQEKYEKKLFNAGVFYLQRYAASIDHFKTILARKLKKKWAEEETLEPDFAKGMIERTAEKLKGYGALNDGIYAGQLFRKFHQQGLGRAVIIQKMKLKRLSDDQIKQAEEDFLQEHNHNNEDAEYERAQLYFKRKIAKLRLPEQEEKAISRMARAGFSYNIIKSLLKTERDLPETPD
ncbi:MAG: hypothetical protein GC136_05550 [Alphaproteobacteria bacterium]|nr:hypothetical protein [Alphaproteobacteria bacterium]